LYEQALKDGGTSQGFSQATTTVALVGGVIDTEEEITDPQIFPQRIEEPILAKTAEFTIKGPGLGGEAEMFCYRLAANRDLSLRAKDLARILLTFL